MSSGNNYTRSRRIFSFQASVLVILILLRALQVDALIPPPLHPIVLPVPSQLQLWRHFSHLYTSWWCAHQCICLQIDRQINIGIQIDKHRHIDRQIDRHIHIHINRQIDRHINIDRYIDRQTHKYRQINRQTYTYRKIDRQGIYIYIYIDRSMRGGRQIPVNAASRSVAMPSTTSLMMLMSAIINDTNVINN